MKNNLNFMASNDNTSSIFINSKEFHHAYCAKFITDEVVEVWFRAQADLNFLASHLTHALKLAMNNHRLDDLIGEFINTCHVKLTSQEWSDLERYYQEKKGCTLSSSPSFLET